MKITRDLAYREQLIQEQRHRMGLNGTRRTGTHVSDLIFCVRKAWAERRANFTEDISDTTVLTWLRGLSHEALLADGVEQVRGGHCFQCQQTFSYTPAIQETNKCPSCGDDLLTGTIDWITLEGDDPIVIDDFVPVEMKSTLKSSRKTLEDGEMAWFVDQIKSYMWMHRRDKGRVAVLHIMGDYSRGDVNVRSEGPKAELRVYRLEWDSEAEAEAWGQELEARKSIVEGDRLPALSSASPAHEFICDYCVIGEMLPNGKACERFPWTPEGKRKGTSAAAAGITIEELMAELQETLDATVVELEENNDGSTDPGPSEHGEAPGRPPA